jgi:hypothetical protein
MAVAMNDDDDIDQQMRDAMKDLRAAWKGRKPHKLLAWILILLGCAVLAWWWL